MAEIAFCKIHPSIGIARVGNSPTDYFIGPELPGIWQRPDGGYKDGGDINRNTAPRIKRQAARFRVYGYDASGACVGELTHEHARVEWGVHVANKKAEWDVFRGRAGENLPLGERRPPEEWRNRDIRGDASARAVLVIDPGSRSVTGPDKRQLFDGGRFMGIDVPLGEIRTDAVGRLVVLGGYGKSGTSEIGRRISHYANNDRWYDDVSDGPVTASVTLDDGRTLNAHPAWVVIAPPDYAPEVTNIITLYDVVRDLAIAAGMLPTPTRPSFTADIFPLLQRAMQMGWVHAEAVKGHGPRSSTAGNFTRQWTALASAAPEHRTIREAVLARLRDPNATGAAAQEQATSRFMPPLSGDEGDAIDGNPGRWLTVTKTQYAAFVQWATGDFNADWKGQPELASTVTPEGLDRAALEACAGGAFFPGIEGGWLFRKRAAFSEAFRFSAEKLLPGDLTKQMAVPWQADFFECNTHWWPAQRPDEVLTEAAYDRIKEIDRQLANKGLGSTEPDRIVRDLLVRERDEICERREPWARTLPTDSYAGDNAMVDRWHRLGFVVSARANGERFEVDHAPVYVETETSEYEGLSWADYFYYLVNINRYPNFFPMARELALGFFAQVDFSQENYRPFEYSVDAFDARMDKIYNDFVADMDDADSMEGLSKRAVVEGLRQRAPMNLVDGAWLQRILATGPCDDVQSKLFSIWMDEAGDGKPELNHCNIYDALLRSLDIYLPPIMSRKFAEIDLLPSAWENPVFQLSVGLFPEEFFPELLGMTLFLEWEATPTLMPRVRLLERLGINPQFYRMHVAIDNVTAGHGALAKSAVRQYLDRVRRDGGETLMQEHWRRIWTGYVTWATTGTFGMDLGDYLQRFDGKKGPDDRRRFARERMIALIRKKAPYAQTAHGSKRLGGRFLNELFSDPEKLLDLLAESGWVNPQDPRESRIITELLSFDGRMYKVFDDQERDTLLDWIESLATGTPPQPGPIPIAERMREVVQGRMPAAASEPRHGDYTLPTLDGQQRSVQDWFRSGSPDAIMSALARSQYVVAGSPETSRFMTEVVQELMPNVLTNDEVGTVAEWIRAGCPLAGAGIVDMVSTRSLWVSVREGREPAAALAGTRFGKLRQFIGSGSVH